MLADLRRHQRFVLSFLLGLTVGLGFYRIGVVDRLLLFSVAFCLCYLILSAHLMRKLTSAMLRRHAHEDDEGMMVIVPVAMGAVAISLIAIVLTIQNPHGGTVLRPVLALISVPLGWAMIHTVMAFHYAHLWYARRPDGTEHRCLEFPGLGPVQDARIWDFLYFSFVLGMTAQTADVNTLSTRVRRIALVHSAFSFFYNTVLLALAVNAGIALGQ